MKEGELKGLLDSYRINCRGIDKNGQHALGKDEKEPVIVKVYKEGGTFVHCRHLYDDNKCIASLTYLKDRERAIEKRGLCPYA